MNSIGTTKESINLASVDISINYIYIPRFIKNMTVFNIIFFTLI